MTTITPRNPERKRVPRRWAVSDGSFLVASGKMTGTLKEVQDRAAQHRQRGGGWFDYSTGGRRVKRDHRKRGQR